MTTPTRTAATKTKQQGVVDVDLTAFAGDNGTAHQNTFRFLDDAMQPPRSLQECYDTRLKWVPEGDEWDVMDHTHAQTTTQGLLAGSFKSFKSRRTKDQKHLCLWCGQEITYHEHRRPLAHLLGKSSKTCEEQLFVEVARLISVKNSVITPDLKTRHHALQSDFKKTATGAIVKAHEALVVRGLPGVLGVAEKYAKAKEAAQKKQKPFFETSTTNELDDALCRFLAANDLAPNASMGKGWVACTRCSKRTRV